MTWTDLCLLLENMKAQKHSCFGSPSVRVTAIINDEKWYLDLAESLSTGELIFIPHMGE